MNSMKKRIKPQRWERVKKPDSQAIDYLVRAHIREIVIDALPGINFVSDPRYTVAEQIVQDMFCNEPLEDFVLRKAGYSPSYRGRSMTVYDRLVKESAEILRIIFPEYRKIENGLAGTSVGEL